MEYRIGDVVKPTENATYYDGKTMPSWVKEEQWIVKSVKGDRVVIDQNISKTRSICSPVNAAHLVCVDTDGEKTKQTSPTAKTTQAQTAAITQEQQKQTGTPKAERVRRNISPVGVELIAKFEGCRLAAYKCPAGIWTIGYGHTAGVKPGDQISQEQAKSMLATDLKKYADYVNKYQMDGTISFALNQNQFDALTSFTYNCGAGSLKNLVAGRTAQTVADKLLAYNKGGGKVLAGLTRRREAERKLFLS